MWTKRTALIKVLEREDEIGGPQQKEIYVNVKHFDQRNNRIDYVPCDNYCKRWLSSFCKMYERTVIFNSVDFKMVDAFTCWDCEYPKVQMQGEKYCALCEC